MRRRPLLCAWDNAHGAGVRRGSTDICIEAELYLRLMGEPYLLRFRRASISTLFLAFFNYHYTSHAVEKSQKVGSRFGLIKRRLKGRHRPHPESLGSTRPHPSPTQSDRPICRLIFLGRVPATNEVNNVVCRLHVHPKTDCDGREDDDYETGLLLKLVNQLFLPLALLLLVLI